MLLAELVLTDSWLMLIGGTFVAQIIAAIAWAVRTGNTVGALKVQIEALDEKLTAKIGHIEQWQQERIKPIEEYYHRQELLGSRLTAVEEQIKATGKTLERIESKLDRLSERGQ
jgi:biotin-(acetyl-CoA carboxylase) ligase